MSWIFDIALHILEGILRKRIPNLSKEDVEEKGLGFGTTWMEPEAYYFLNDPSPRFGERVRDIKAWDRTAISFWWKRGNHRRGIT